jgi:hypothetical protein
MEDTDRRGFFRLPSLAGWVRSDSSEVTCHNSNLYAIIRKASTSLKKFSQVIYFYGLAQKPWNRIGLLNLAPFDKRCSSIGQKFSFKCIKH